MKILPERFWSKVRMTNTCWIWTASNQHGYGYFGIEGKLMRVHRLVYETMVGPIPNELVLHHLCNNTLCVNPEHLEPVTQRENVLFGKGVTSNNFKKTHCLRGHLLSDDNLAKSNRNRRICRKCKLIRNREWKIKKVKEDRCHE